MKPYDVTSDVTMKCTGFSWERKNLMHGSFESCKTREPLLSSGVLYGAFNLIGCYWTYAYQWILEIGADLRKLILVYIDPVLADNQVTT